MADLIKKIKIKKQDGTFTDYIPIGAEAQNISTNDGDSVQLKLNKKPYYYNSVADMKADLKLKAGDMAITIGYYEPNDGGAAEYRIISGTHTDDGGNYHELNNELFAELIIKDNKINIKQLGAISNDNTKDLQPYLQKYRNICDNKGITFILFIPEGDWYCSPWFVLRNEGVIIEGQRKFPGRGQHGTRIYPFQQEQDYVWKFGGLEDMGTSTIPYANTTTGVCCSNLTFSTDNEQVVKYGGICLEYADYGVYDHIYFQNFYGCPLYIRSSWENEFNVINFRGIGDNSRPCVWFADTRSVSGVSANISSSFFDKFMFESVSGDCFYLERGCAFVNNHFGEINLEYGLHASRNETSTSADENTDFSTMQGIYIFNGNMYGTTIQTINYSGNDAKKAYLTNSETDIQYYFGGCFHAFTNGSNSNADLFSIAVDQIYMKARVPILVTSQPYAAGFNFSLNNLVSYIADWTDEFFEVTNAGKMRISQINTRDYNDNMNTGFGWELYKYGTAGTTSSKTGAFSKGRLCLQKNPNSTWVINHDLYYPFKYSATTKKIFLLRFWSSNGQYYIPIRSTVNGEQYDKVYSHSATGEEGWIELEIPMNFDKNAEIKLFNCTASLYFDTLTYLRDEPIESGSI